MNVDLSKSSVVQWFEGTEKHRCGYCKNQSSVSMGMWAESLTVDDYQDLIDRGWRRSGKYCYKPIMEKTCCPLYTIKCDAVNFLLSKSQKKVIKKFNKFLRDGELNSKDNSSESHIIEESESCIIVPREMPKINLDTVKSDISECMDINTVSLEGASNSVNCEKSEEISHKKDEKIQEKTEKICDKIANKSSQKNVHSKTSLTEEVVGADPNKPPCKKAKLLRIEKKKAKAIKKGISFEKTQTVKTGKSLEEFLEEGVSDDNKIKLRISLIPTSIPNSSWNELQDIEFELYKKYQMIIHNDPPSKLTLNGFNRFLVKSPLKTILERMTSTSDNFSLSAELYKKYQMKIHNDPPHECNEDQFYNFLVETPLQPQSFPEDIDGPGYGSFHQQYWLNDKLIAVGVIDILPRCVSSVYFFYDPDYRSLTLGTYGSMREVQLTRNLQKSLPNLSNYYMGFYIHSCPKMRYKGKLSPSYLVCPETYSWIPIEKCIPLLEVNKYSRLNDDIDALDDNAPSEEDVLKTKIVYRFRLMSFRDYKTIIDDEKYREIGHLVGKTCLNSLIFWEQ